eukprot:3612493-Prymnesium_polylepis.1
MTVVHLPWSSAGVDAGGFPPTPTADQGAQGALGAGASSAGAAGSEMGSSSRPARQRSAALTWAGV